MCSKATRVRRICTRSNRSAFSLTELMVVIVIIGLLAGAVAVGARTYMAAGRKGVAKMEIAKITEALESYAGVNVKYPTTQDGLHVLMDSTAEQPGGWLKGGDLNDPWGNPYEYIVPGENGEPYEVVSSGPDGRLGTTDDISSMNLEE